MIIDAINQVGAELADGFTRILPRAITAVVIIASGWVIAIFVRTIVRLVLGWLRVDASADRLGIAAPMKSAGLPAVNVLCGSIAFWLVWIAFILSGVDEMGFQSAQGLAAGFAAFVPRLIEALAILVVGVVAANFAGRATLLTAVNARMPSPRLLGGAVRWLILILVGAMALEQMAVASTIVLTAFAIAFGALMLGLAIAFGIGGGQLAKRILEHQFPEPESSPADRISHL
jgi:hypothetical protein